MHPQDLIDHFPLLLVQVLLGALALSLIFYLHLVARIKHTVDWVRKVRLGQAHPEEKHKTDKLLHPLTSEIAHMAQSLAMAQWAAEEEARLRHHSESIWTAERLKEFVKNQLSGHPLFVVSNREPYQHVWKNKKIECVVPASGLVTAIEPMLKACGGTWIATGDADADRETVDEDDCLQVPPHEPQYTLRRVWLKPEEEQGYYYGFSNEGLWPLCHIAHTRPVFRVSDWEVYREVNQKFAKAVLEEIKNIESPCVLIQDYHFALLPELIKSERPDARVSLFWHIPWPNPESFGICPWQKALLKGMLGADIVGFHTQFHCNNFLETVDRFLESRIDYEKFSVHCEGHRTWVKPFPISIAFSENHNHGAAMSAPSGEEDFRKLLKSHGIAAQWVGVGVDRLDYTKGILERFKAIEYFLDTNPAYKEKFTFVELAAPSRLLIPKYQELASDVEREAERINSRISGKNWKPILLIKKHHSHEEILPFYKFADLCLVTSLHDGMNLVAKEFVAARTDERGALILSQFTGAARELTEALIVNPYDTAELAEAIRRALEMSDDEQKERMREMRRVLKERNIFRWAGDLVGELAQVRVTEGHRHGILVGPVG